MRLRGIRPKNKVKIKWSPGFAYAIGLLATDGNLSPDGRHLNLTTRDLELVESIKTCLGLKNKIGRKARGGEKEKKYFVIQFGDVNFYKFLMGIGLMSRKSKDIRDLDIPDKYFFDFLRGHFDGDGTFYSYFDKRWQASHMFYTTFVSASAKNVEWLRGEISRRLKIKGHITKAKKSSVYQLKYAKAESLKLLPKMYYAVDVVCLSRKRDKIQKAIKIEAENNKYARVAKLVDAQP